MIINCFQIWKFWSCAYLNDRNYFILTFVYSIYNKTLFEKMQEQINAYHALWRKNRNNWLTFVFNWCFVLSCLALLLHPNRCIQKIVNVPILLDRCKIMLHQLRCNVNVIVVDNEKWSVFRLHFSLLYFNVGS